MKGIATINFKGGVGKTTITWLLARYAAEKRGKRILIVDTDAQMSLSSTAIYQHQYIKQTTAWYDTHKSSAYTLANLIKLYSTTGNKIHLLDKDIKEIICYLTPTLSLIPSTEGMYGMEYDLNYQGSKYFFRDLIKKVGKRKNFDYVFFDCSPNFSPISCSVLNYCSLFLVPVIPDIFARGAVPTMTNVLSERIDQIKKKKFGVFMNRVNYYRGNPNSQASDNWAVMKNKMYPKNINIEFWETCIPDLVVIPKSLLNSALLESKTTNPKIERSIITLWEKIERAMC